MLACTLRLGLALALTQVGPEAVARLCPAARLLVVISLGSGVTKRSGPHPPPLAGQHLTQTSHARSQTRSPLGACQRRGTRDRSGTLPCPRRGGQRGPIALSLIDTHAAGFRVVRRMARLRAAMAFFFRRTLGFS